MIEELYEFNQLLDGSIHQLQEDMEDRVAEINLLNDTTSNNIRQNGIEIAKVRHLAVLNGEHISQNLKTINDNRMTIETTVESVKMNLEASINNVEASLESDLEASIASVKMDVDASFNSVNTDIDNIEVSIDLVKEDIQQNVANLASSIDVNSNSIEGSIHRVEKLESLQIYFAVYRSSSSDAYFNGYVTYNNEVENVGNHLALSTGIFTSPVRGTFQFTFSGTGFTSGRDDVGVYVNGYKHFIIYSDNNQYDGVNHSWFLSLNQNDQVRLKMERGQLMLRSDVRFTFIGNLIKVV